MKTRQGFVSNSSSSSFIVALHQDLELTEDQMAKVEDMYFYYNDHSEGERLEFLKVFELAFKMLKTSGGIWIDDRQNYARIGRALVHVLREEIVLLELRCGDGEGQVLNLLSADTKDQTMKILKDKLK